ncbi:MAG: alpha-amylase family glycosyl hydrolase, partial [Hyphomonas sp.]
MIRSAAAAAMALLGACAALPAASPEAQGTPAASEYEARRTDWRIGAVTYQVFVDRYVPSADLDAKRELYAAPRALEAWNTLPSHGHKVDGSIHWSHELAFWGGDLASLRTKVGYLHELGVDVLYLNPIQYADSNHKYDAIDYRQVSPEYGTKADLKALADDLHADGMRLILDGVFNHMGENATWFLDAAASPDSPYRDWFTFNPDVENGYVGWWGIAALPELNWENPEVRREIADAPDSVVRSWFDEDIDGWRLDVATELGLDNLAAITAASHEEKPGSLVIGEVWSY